MSLTINKINQDDIDIIAKDKSVYVPIEQTCLWQEFDSAISNRQAAGVFGFYNGDDLVAFAAITAYSNKGYKWWWVKYGPVFVGQVSSSQKIQVVKCLKQMAKESANSVAFIRATLPTLGIKLHKQLQHMIYDRTIIIDLLQNNTAEKLLASYTRHGRYEVKQSLKKGVECSLLQTDNAVNDFNKYYAILDETAKRDDFYALPKSTYITMLKTMPKNTSFYVAKYKNQPVSWAIITSYNNYAKYYYAAGNKTARDTGAAYALQYYIMQDLLKKGIATYDLMGIASQEFPELQSVTGFKKKFSKNITDIDKTYDIVCSPLKYSLVKNLKRAKKLAKKAK